MLFKFYLIISARSKVI